MSIFEHVPQILRQIIVGNGEEVCIVLGGGMGSDQGLKAINAIDKRLITFEKLVLGEQVVCMFELLTILEEENIID